MKKISTFLLVVMVTLFGTFFSACGEDANKDIFLSHSNVTIYLGETEENLEVVNAKPQNVSVNSLSIFYDNTNINITQSEKKSDGSFDLYITPNGEAGCEEVEVIVKAGADTQKAFYVSVVVPVTDISVEDDITIPFSGTEIKYNLANALTFAPETTKQKNIAFELLTEGLDGKASIEGNYLVLSEDFNVFNSEINLVVQSLDKSEIRKEFSVIVVPSTKFYAGEIQMFKVDGGAENAISADGYVVNIENNEFSSPLEFVVRIPKTLGIGVDVATLHNEQLNISQYLTYQKTSEEVALAGGTYVEYTFTFESLNLKTGKGNLYFNFYYLTGDEAGELSSVFAITESAVVDCIPLEILIPLKQIGVSTTCEQDVGGAYKIYKSYNLDAAFGSEFIINSVPMNATEKTLILKALTNVKVYKWDNTSASYVEIFAGEQILAGTSLFVCGNIEGSASIVIEKYTAEGTPSAISKTINFVVLSGATSLGFVETVGSTDVVSTKEIAVECGNAEGTSVILYANGTKLADLVYNGDLFIQPWGGDPNSAYYEVKVVANEAGQKEYVISTANGYEVTLIVNAIKTITEVNISLKNQSQDTSGVHNVQTTLGSVSEFSIEHGYSAGLSYEIDEDAEIAKINYYFADAVLGEEEYLSAYAASYLNFNAATAVDYINYSMVVNTQNLKESHLITSLREGKVVIKVEIIGYVVENGIVKESTTPIEKYICVEVYRPISDISSTSKTITLRAKNQLAETDYVYATAEIDLNTIANGGKLATYKNLFIDGGYVENQKVYDSVDVVIEDLGRIKYSIVLDRETNKLNITVDSVPANYNFGVQNIVLFGADFYLGDGCSLNTVKQNYKPITYTIYLNIVQTNAIEDINVTSLKLTSVKENEEQINGAHVMVTTKTYERIYLDVSKSSGATNVYKIVTEVLPINAFNKQLKYAFVPDTNYSAGLVDVSSNDGTIYYSDAEGGTGNIIITPADSKNNTIKVIIPITVADGNSEATAFQITSLVEIKNPNKHYVITTLSTLELNDTLFSGAAFKGGLYGKLDANAQNATIKLNGCSLFDVISNEAKVKNITIYGDVNASGFVANENKGYLENISITTYVNNGVYVPSLLTARQADAIVGGIVGKNLGEIKACEFSGSIKKSTATTAVGGISGENLGTETGCEINVAKFEYVSQTVGRVILDGENYVNGIIDATASTGNPFTGANVNTGSSLSGAEYVKTINFVQGGFNSLGQAGLKNGVVFYFAAKDAAKQFDLNEYNIIKISDLINSSCAKIKVLAQNLDGTNCQFVSVSGDNIVISGIGEFILKIYSAHDYTSYQTINMLSVYYFSDFGIYDDGKLIENGDIFTILKGGRDVVTSKTTAKVDGIELKQNAFEISFILNGENAVNYITGTTFGSHTINALWEAETATLKISLKTGYASIFDTLINSALTPDGNYQFGLSMKLGTTKIEMSANSGGVEPKDSISFNAYITTDIVLDDGEGNITTQDKILPSTIEIKNSNGIICTDKFEIYVGGAIYQAATGRFGFEISVYLKEAYRHEKTFVNQEYIVKIQAINGADIYDAYATFTLTILPQSLSDVGATLYNITSTDGVEINVSKTETPTSVLGQSDSGLLVIDLFPNYSTFDYIEIVATSNTMARLAYRVQKQVEGSKNKYEYDDDAKYEALTDVNGIRIQNNFAGMSLDQDIGTYYILIFATNTLNQDAIFDVSVNVYYKGEKLDEYTNFTLYIRMPASPEVSINGQTKVYAYPGETLVANVTFPEDQVLKVAKVIDVNGTKLEIDVYSTHIETTGGYNNYKLQFTIPKDFDISAANNMIRLYVESLKQNRGEQESVFDELPIYLVNFKINSDSIAIKDANDGVFNISSIKYSEVELYTNFEYSLNEEGINEAVDFFNSKYYFDNEAGFSIGSNLPELSKAQILSTYLYYVKDNATSPVYTINNEGEVVKATNSWYSNYIDFNIKNPVYDAGTGELISDYKLQVKGGESTGEVPMLLQIYYSMPDGATYVYEYNFKFVNSLYTTEDMPIEIVDGASFLETAEEETAYDYILANDIYLYEYEVMADTSKIKSLDGNNYTIHIMSFVQPTQTSATFALFNTISSDTTIKNLSVNYYYLNDIEIIDEITEVKFAGLAITNNGVVANCEVTSFAGKEKSPTFTTYGLKLTISDKSTANVNAAGFVINNTGSITNSRVGGTEKLITKYDYTDDQNPTLIETYAGVTTFTIRTSGTISGFVYSNIGVISSSYAKNISIINTYNKNETKITSGFVNSNEGTIAMSYAEGVKSADEIQASGGGIEATGIMAGFVYSNLSKITDCYSNIMLHTSNNQVGRLGAGFVYYNAPEGYIEASYSFSSISGNNTTQLNFAGITDLMEYNNLGTIKNCYYYVTDTMESVSIESMYNTEINTVTNVGDQLNFYGFSFASLYAPNLNSTWASTPTGPSLVGANNIAHSVRYRVDNPNAGESSLEYIYVYEDKYDLGTANNPIIIRNAQEFNGVFGGYSGTNTEIEENYSLATKKVFGSYRLVNNIDLNELIIEDKEDTDYKYDLASTKMTLTGEMSELSNRTGSFDGNGLTITNLAISNSTSGSENFGMFKTIEKGASVSNVNIVLTKGGVNADNTKNVGTITGTLSNSAVVNVSISTNSQEDHTDVIGSNIVGGAVGRVIENSYIFGVEISGISVIATYNQANTLGSGYQTTDNYVYNRNTASVERLSIAGGAFGVVDIYTQEQLATNENRDADEILFANVQSVKVSGGMTILATTASGVIGYVGKYVIAKDMALEVTKSEKSAKIIAYSNGIAGGVVGYNMGFLYQIRAEHERTWQTQIEENIGSYYRATNEQTRAEIDRGNINLFQNEDSEVTYKPSVIGGIVGYLENGVINVSYSKINVRNQYASIAGGVVGFVKKNADDTGAEGTYIAQLTQVYATGDVYAGGEGRTESFTGGIIGLNSKNNLALDKVNALNYWSIDTINGVRSKSNSHIAQIAITEVESVTIQDLALLKYTTDTLVFGTGETYRVLNTLKSDKSSLDIDTNEYKTIEPYYNYYGAYVDNGALVDIAFTNFDWYETGNWSRDAGEVYPHIRFVVPTTVYDIYDKNDFWKFSFYGSNPEAKFIVRSEEPIDCTGWVITYSLIKGSITGMYPNSGFKNLAVPLFTKASGAKISNLVFVNCSAPFVEVAEGTTKFSYLSYTGCTFAGKVKGSGESAVNNYGGIAYEISAYNIDFTGITFTDCVFSGAEDVEHQSNIGFLFATTTASTSTSANINITGVTIKNADATDKIISAKVTKNSNIGLLYGTSEVKTNIQNISITAKLEVEVAGFEAEAAASATGPEVVGLTSIGLIAGYSKVAELKNISIEKGSTIQTTGVDEDGIENNEQVAVGGLVGKANIFRFATEADDGDTSQGINYFANNIKVTGTQKASYVGGVVGYIAAASETEGFINSMTNDHIMVGSIETTYALLEVSLAKETTCVGGIVGFAGAFNSSTSQKYLMYNGNIVIDQTEQADSDETRYAYIGGVIGQLGEAGTERASELNKVVYSGTINFKGTEVSPTYYIGGIIGSVEEDNTAHLTDVFAIGDISLNGKNGNVTSEEDGFVGGIIGQVQDGATAKMQTVVSLATIYNKHEYDGENLVIDFSIDAIANKHTRATIEIGDNDVAYAINVTLCTTNLNDGKTSSDPTFIDNVNYNKVVGQEATNAKIPSDIKEIYSKYSTKLDPIVYDNAMDSSSFDAICSLNDETENHRKFVGKDEYRRAYIYLSNAESLDLERRISLQNAFMFSDGGIFYTERTPFNTIDANSVVSGIVAKVKITNNDNGQSGFANKNDGIIYMCSAQEPFVYFEDTASTSIRTELFGYIKASKVGNFAGFVITNNGYIFGSNSNMQIEATANIKAAGFVYNNTGTIEYSYSSGYVNLETSGAIGAIDVFATNSGIVDTDSCYSIFSNLASTSSSNNSDVRTSSDEIENASMGDDSLYGAELNDIMASKLWFNDYYPVLLNGEFASDDFNYIRRANIVYKHTNSITISGLTEDVVYFNEIKEGAADDDGDGSADEYIVIPNIKAFTEIESNYNYVLARDLNLGYDTGKIYSASLLDTFDNGILHGYGHSITNGKFTGANAIKTIGSGATVERLSIETLTLKDSTGFIGTNKGLITNVNINKEIVVEASETGITNKGVLVGRNEGTLRLIQASAQVSLSGALEEYYFGVVAGESASGSKMESVTLHMAKVNVVEDKDDLNIHIGGLVGELSGGTLENSGISNDKTEIFAASKGITYVGGLVGTITASATIKNCYIGMYDYSRSTAAIISIIGGAEETGDIGIEGGEPVGFMTSTSYVGGIVGNVAGGTPIIQDCLSYANVTARAQWKAASTEEAYKYDVATNEILVYRYMDSAAYAGGICANYVTDGNTANGVSGENKVHRVASFGEVEGGFKAWKPIAAISANGQGTLGTSMISASTATLGIGMGIYAVAKRKLLKEGIEYTIKEGIEFAIKKGVISIGGKIAAKGAAYYVPYVGWALAIIDALITIYELNEMWRATQELKKITIGVTMFNGNSDSVLAVECNNEGSTSTNNIGTQETSSKTTITGAKLENVIEKHQQRDKDWDGSTWLEPDYRSRYTGRTQYGYFDDEDGVTLTMQEVELEYITSVTDTKYINYGVVNDEYMYYDDALKYNTSTALGESSILAEVHYDAICPTLTGTNKNVYSNVSDYLGGDDFGFINLKTSNQPNQELRFKTSATGKLDKYTMAPSTSAAWNAVENGRDSWNKDGQLIVSVPKAMKYSETEEGYKVFTITDAKTWINLVYTINNGSVMEGNVQIEADVNPYLGTDIVIEIADGVEDIVVGSNILKEFNGTLNVKGDTKFIELNLFMQNGTEQIGLIAYSHSAKLNNVIVSGNATIEYQQVSDAVVKPCDVGMLVGKVGTDTYATGVVLTNCAFIQENTEQVAPLANAEYKMTAFGGLVGSVSGGAVTIANSKVEIGNIQFNAPQSEITLGGFGGVIGSVNSGTAEISATKVQIAQATIISGINSLGGLVGHNAGTTRISGVTTINLGEIYLVSAGASAYTGGVVGYNSGTVTIDDSVSIGTSALARCILSADVLDGSKYAYAGGVMGYNLNTATKNLNATFNIGTKDDATGYNKVMYILAGTNAYVVTNGTCSIPSAASVGKIVGNENIVLGNIYGVYEKAVAIDNSFSASGMTTGAYDNGHESAISSLGYTISNASNKHTISFDNSGSKPQGYTKESNSYTINHKSYNNSRVSDNSEVNEWLLTYEFVNKSQVFDGEGYVTYNINVTFKWLIRITPNNTFINDQGKYLLQVILLNAKEITDLSDDEGELTSITISGTDVSEPLIVYSYLFNINTSQTIDLSVDLDDDGEIDLTSLNLYGYIGAFIDNKISGNTTGSETYRVLFSDGMYFEVSGGTIALKEKFKKQESITDYKWDDTNSVWTPTDQRESDIVDVTTRNIFTKSFNSGEYYTFTSQDAGGVISGVDSTTFILDNGGTVVSGTFNEDIVYNGKIIPYNLIKYDGKKATSFVWYSGVVNDQNIKILNIVCENGDTYNVTDLVFNQVIDGPTKLYYLGSMKYTLTSEAYTYINFANRYESFMPVFPVMNTHTGSMVETTSIYNIVCELAAVIDGVDNVEIGGFSASSIKLNNANQLEETIQGYNLTLANGVLSFAKGELSARVQEPTPITITMTSGSYAGVTCDGYYLYKGKLVGYKNGTEYFYYNYYNGTHRSVSNGLNVLSFYVFN